MPEPHYNSERLAVLETDMKNVKERQDRMEENVEKISTIVWKGVGAVTAIVTFSEIVHFFIQLHK